MSAHLVELPVTTGSTVNNHRRVSSLIGGAMAALLVIIGLVAISSGPVGSPQPSLTPRLSGLSTSTSAPAASTAAATNLFMAPTAGCTAAIDDVDDNAAIQECDGKVWITSNMEVPHIGLGYTMGKGMALVAAAEIEPGYVAPSPSNGMNCIHCAKEVKSFEEASEWLKGSLDIKVPGIEVQGSYNHSQSSTHQSGLYVARVQCVSEFQAVPMKLQPAYKPLCKGRYRDFEGMFGYCVVSSIANGYELNLMIDMTSASSESKNSLSGKLSLGFGSAKLSIGAAGGNEYKSDEHLGKIHATSFGLNAKGRELIPNGPLSATAVADANKLLANLPTYADNGGKGSPIAFMTKPWSELSNSCRSNFNRTLCLENIESSYLTYKGYVDKALIRYEEGVKDPSNYYRHASYLYIYHHIESGWTVEPKETQFGVAGELSPGPRFNAGVPTDTTNWDAMILELRTLQTHLKNWMTAYKASQVRFCKKVFNNFEDLFLGKASAIGFPGSPSMTEVEEILLSAPKAECPMGSCPMCGVKTYNNNFAVGSMKGSHTGDAYTSGTTWGPSQPLCCRGDQMLYRCYCWNQAIDDVGLMCNQCFCCGGATTCPGSWGTSSYTASTAIIHGPSNTFYANPAIVNATTPKAVARLLRQFYNLTV